jgi:hypothetical protein
MTSGRTIVHVTPEALEHYSLGTIKNQRQLAALEEHLLACEYGVDRVVQTDDWVREMKAALRSEPIQMVVTGRRAKPKNLA